MFRIILVDDDEDYCLTMKKLLEIQGFDVAICFKPGTVTAALRIKTDLLITDWEMPQMSGATVLKLCRASSPFTRMIVLTGNPTMEARLEAEQQGIDLYLQKPIRSADLLEKVMRIIGEER